MAYKHQVTDSRGNVHKRVSLNRQYRFAIVTFCSVMPATETRCEIPARTHCSWSATEKRAQQTAKYARGYWAFESVEIIPCTPEVK